MCPTALSEKQACHSLTAGIGDHLALLAASRQTSEDVTDTEAEAEAEAEAEVDNHAAQIFKPAGLTAHQRTRLSNMMRLRVIAFIRPDHDNLPAGVTLSLK